MTGDTIDVRDLQGKAKEEINKLKQTDHDEVEILIDYIQNSEDIGSASTVRNKAQDFRVILEFIKKENPISRYETEGEIQEYEYDGIITTPTASLINTLINKLADHKDWKDSTKRNPLNNIRAYLRYKNKEDIADNINVPNANSSQVDEETVLTLSEVQDLMEVANHSKWRALVAFLWETGNRISAALSVRVGDIERFQNARGTRYAKVKIPESIEGDKDAAGNKKNLTWSLAYVDDWLDDHPRPDDDDAALFCIHRRTSKKNLGEHLAPNGVNGKLKRMAKKADIDSGRITAHAFRHSRNTYMAKNGYSKNSIEAVMDWKEDTEQHQRYSHLLPDEKANTVLNEEGVELADEDDSGSDETIIECPNCGSRNLSTARACNTCQLKLTDSAPTWFSVYTDFLEADEDIAEGIHYSLEKYDEQTAPSRIESLSPSLYRESIFYVAAALAGAYQRDGFLYDPETAEELFHEIFGDDAMEKQLEHLEKNEFEYKAAGEYDESKQTIKRLFSTPPWEMEVDPERMKESSK